MSTRTIVLAFAAMLFGILVANVFAPSSLTRAQTQAPASSGIYPGPEGVWVLNGNKLYVCRTPPIHARSITAPPPTPECGVPLTLR